MAKRKTEAKGKSLFDHLNAITTSQKVDYWDKLDPIDQKSYTVYMINRFLSMNMDYVEVVNALQLVYGPITNRDSYLFYSQFLPRKKLWNKYIKAQKKEKYEKWLLELLAMHFSISQSEAETYLDLFASSQQGKDRLKQILEMYGTDPKKVKKATK